MVTGKAMISSGGATAAHATAAAAAGNIIGASVGAKGLPKSVTQTVPTISVGAPTAAISTSGSSSSRDRRSVIEIKLLLLREGITGS
jgi:hypothetical protein